MRREGCGGWAGETGGVDTSSVPLALASSN